MNDKIKRTKSHWCATARCEKCGGIVAVKEREKKDKNKIILSLSGMKLSKCQCYCHEKNAGNSKTE